MNLIKRLIPNSVKQKGKNFLYDVLKIRYSVSGVPLEILDHMPNNRPVVFFDIGAHGGHFSDTIVKAYQIKRGILVEPLAHAIPILQNKFPDKGKILIINAAVADTNGETEFFVNPEADFVSSLLRINNKNEELAAMNIKDPVSVKVKTITIDKISADEQLDSVDLLKIDVQGAEHLVLNGAIETLKITKLVYTEFSFKPIYAQSSTFYDLYNFLYAHNFILTNVQPGYVSPGGELLQGDALFVNKDFLV